jgi:hypothetical protein
MFLYGEKAILVKAANGLATLHDCILFFVTRLPQGHANHEDFETCRHFETYGHFQTHAYFGSCGNKGNQVIKGISEQADK